MGAAKGTKANTEARFVPVSTQDELDRLLAASSEHPIVLFKHDYACSISVHAYWDLVSVPGEISLVDVARDRAISHAIAAQLGVRHESPQVIVIRDGHPVYAASHWDICPEAVAHAADRDKASPPNPPDQGAD